MAFRWLKDNVGGAKAPKEKYSLEMLQCVQCRLSVVVVGGSASQYRGRGATVLLCLGWGGGGST
eukprot:COSAG02_NODE_2524_length_8607_cov_3.188528_2_plen_64_part_00